MTRPGNLQRHQLVDELNRTLEQLQLLAGVLQTQAETLGCTVASLQYPSGELALAPIVTAQAQALAALTQLEHGPGATL